MHNILNYDLQEGIEQAWHGLTQVRPRIDLHTCWLTKWDIERVPLYIGEESTGSTGKNILTDTVQTSYDMLRCTDNGHLIGRPVGPSYGEITNAKFLDMINSAIGGTAHRIVSVGSLRNRGRVFVTIKLDQDTLTKIGNRQFLDYLTAGNSHDQSCELFWMNSNTCTVCDNTFSMNLASVRRSVEEDEQDEQTGNARVRHSKNAVAKLPGIADIINKAVGVRAEFYAALREFDKQPCNDLRAERIFAGFEAGKEAEQLATITRRRVNDLVLLHNKGRGNTGKTLLDLFSAGTDYYTHSHTGSTNQRQWESSEYGVGAVRKRSLFTLLTDPNRVAATEKRGAVLLEAAQSQFE